MALNACRFNPTSKFVRQEYDLIGRDDLAMLSNSDNPGARLSATLPAKSEDGMEDIQNSEVCKLRWPGDKRVIEVIFSIIAKAKIRKYGQS